MIRAKESERPKNSTHRRLVRAVSLCDRDRRLSLRVFRRQNNTR